MQICYHSFYSSPIQQENLTLKNVGLIHFQLDMNSVTVVDESIQEAEHYFSKFIWTKIYFQHD